MTDVEIELIVDHCITELGPQAAYRNHDFARHHLQRHMPTPPRITENKASAAITRKIDCTTLTVV